MHAFFLKGLEVFSRWFCSPAGVYQTLIVTMGLVIYEMLNPGWDAHGFWLLYGLTIYSAVTQPALAFVAHRSALSVDIILGHLEDMVENDIQMDGDQLRVIKRIAHQLGAE